MRCVPPRSWHVRSSCCGWRISPQATPSRFYLHSCDVRWYLLEIPRRWNRSPSTTNHWYRWHDNRKQHVPYRHKRQYRHSSSTRQSQLSLRWLSSNHAPLRTERIQSWHCYSQSLPPLNSCGRFRRRYHERYPHQWSRYILLYRFQNWCSTDSLSVHALRHRNWRYQMVRWLSPQHPSMEGCIVSRAPLRTAHSQSSDSGWQTVLPSDPSCSFRHW